MVRTSISVFLLRAATKDAHLVVGAQFPVVLVLPEAAQSRVRGAEHGLSGLVPGGLAAHRAALYRHHVLHGAVIAVRLEALEVIATLKKQAKIRALFVLDLGAIFVR